MIKNFMEDISCVKNLNIALGIVTTTGAGKSKSVRTLIDNVAKNGDDGSIIIFIPNLNLAREQLVEIRNDLPHLHSELYLGVKQPDPSNSSMQVCRRHKIDELASKGIPIKSLCGNKHIGYCSHHTAVSSTPCAYSAQSLKTPDIWICTHAMLFIRAPEFFGRIKLKIIDETFLSSAYKKNNKIELDDIEDISNYKPGSYLQNISSTVCKYIRVMQDGYIDVSIISGFVDNRLIYSLDDVIRVQVSLSPNSTDQEIDNALNQFKGSRSYTLAMFWSLVAQSFELKVGRSPSLYLENKNCKPTVNLTYMSHPNPAWDAPTVLLDSTMPVEINKIFYKNLKIDRIYTESSFTRYLQITDSLLSQTQFIRTQITFQKVIDIITVTASKIPDSHPIKILVVCSKYVEDELNKRGLPAGCETIHYGAVTGSNRYSSVPCCYVSQ
jgi:hypothetical protein